MNCILLLYPYNRRTIPIDVALKELIKRGHKVILLTFSPRGDLHEVYEKLGCETYSNDVSRKSSTSFYYNQLRFLLKFCRKRDIDIIFSHLQEANLISSIAQYFCNAKFIIFRHHCYYQYLQKDSELKPNNNLRIGDIIVNRLANKIVVPSLGVKKPMIEREGVEASKIEVIPYIYSIGQMLKSVDIEEVSEIRKQYSTKLLLIMVSRLIPYKQHFKTLPVFKELIYEGYDLKVMIMDDSGNEGKKIQSYIDENRLNKRIAMLGFKKNILDYVAASDVLVHPSLTEASCSATKEAGLLEKLVIVNSHVGDFDDYIVNEQTGYSFDASDYNENLLKTIKKVYNEMAIIDKLGKKLKAKVIQNFSYNEAVVNKYIELLK